MIKPRAVLLMLATLAIGIGLGIASRPMPPQTDETSIAAASPVVPTPEPTPSGATQAQVATATNAAGSTAAPTATPLPPADTPLADTFADLRRRAQSGDVSAACRLGQELLTCSFPFVQQLREQDLAELDPGKAKTEQERRRIEHMLTRAEREAWRRDKCAGLTRAQKDEALRWLRVAAEGGHAPSMALYASGMPLQLTNIASQIDEAERYRERALGMMHRLAEAGEVDGARLLSQAYGNTPNHDYPSQILTEGRSATEAMIYGYLATIAQAPKEESGAQSTAAMLARIRERALAAGRDAAATDAALAEAERRFQQWFQGRPSSSHLARMWSYGQHESKDINSVCTGGPWLAADGPSGEGNPP